MNLAGGDHDLLRFRSKVVQGEIVIGGGDDVGGVHRSVNIVGDEHGSRAVLGDDCGGWCAIGGDHRSSDGGVGVAVGRVL